MDFFFFKIEGTGLNVNGQKFLKIEFFELEDFPLILMSKQLERSIRQYIFKTLNLNNGEFKFFIDGYLKDNDCFGFRSGIQCLNLTGYCNCYLQTINKDDFILKQQLKSDLINLIKK
ncbi:hypothetical protein KM759_gp066 [Lymphocystis disease virus 4]|uniref:Uncharacterized protein n=1 Tax=Lymphocystis disease virus 4 TaxID=2704413 RepID=A0A6B9XMP3_9VIRU|nr:hypothetical protein KM759_gp066 [Lymphocystis disease virus 4]QHR78551.1 hypothetical protein [Lymphocystis disease virus 4]